MWLRPISSLLCDRRSNRGQTERSLSARTDGPSSLLMHQKALNPPVCTTSLLMKHRNAERRHATSSDTSRPVLGALMSTPEHIWCKQYWVNIYEWFKPQRLESWKRLPAVLRYSSQQTPGADHVALESVCRLLSLNGASPHISPPYSCSCDCRRRLNYFVILREGFATAVKSRQVRAGW